ncbi:MAG: class I SAM-dependent methyltransferase [Rudaea sp.]|nr:class I SAM-dependent methyltransferase [Rudaea sp.]
MNYLYGFARNMKARSPLLQRMYLRLRRGSYATRMARETDIYKDVENVNVLPDIFAYWANTYVRPMFEDVGVSNPTEFFAKYLRESADRSKGEYPLFISIGAGSCDTEILVAKSMKKAGLSRFVIECLDMNPHILALGRRMAESEGVGEHIVPAIGDCNNWKPAKLYDGIMANQSLHHIVKLKRLFDGVKRVLKPKAYFIVSDIIGRNGHRRWPEALIEVQRFWQELPEAYRYNRQLKRQENVFMDWDCSNVGFEGVRAQDILPLLLERFRMHVFVAFGGVVDIFVDRSFGHNFNANSEWDRDFIDRIHTTDEEGLRSGRLTPTHLTAVMAADAIPNPFWSRGLNPYACVRKPRLIW